MQCYVQSHTVFKKLTPTHIRTHSPTHPHRTHARTHTRINAVLAASATTLLCRRSTLVRRHRHRRELHPLLFLSLVAEPHAYNVLLEVQLLGDLRDLLAGRTWLDGEVRLQGALLGRRYRRALPFLVVDSAEHVDRHLVVASLFLRLLQPRLENGLQRDHVVVTESEGLEAADRALTE